MRNRSQDFPQLSTNSSLKIFFSLPIIPTDPVGFDSTLRNCFHFSWFKKRFQGSVGSIRFLFSKNRLIYLC
ncbi:MAG: hypothetical protein EBT88_01645 [Proteobacteria bacterium]|nr:hypothetical protein [Pseudomonadota bacterium]